MKDFTPFQGWHGYLARLDFPKSARYQPPYPHGTGLSRQWYDELLPIAPAAEISWARMTLPYLISWPCDRLRFIQSPLGAPTINPWRHTRTSRLSVSVLVLFCCLELVWDQTGPYVTAAYPYNSCNSGSSADQAAAASPSVWCAVSTGLLNY